MTLTRDRIYELKSMGIRVTFEELEALCDMALNWLAVQPRPIKMLAKRQPCGCVVCTCENEEQCHGCGAKHCGAHPLGEIPNPIYLTSLPEPKI